MMEERYHATKQNRFYPDMSNVNKNITVEANLNSPSTYFLRVGVIFTTTTKIINVTFIFCKQKYFYMKKCQMEDTEDVVIRAK